MIKNVFQVVLKHYYFLLSTPTYFLGVYNKKKRPIVSYIMIDRSFEYY